MSKSGLCYKSCGSYIVTMQKRPDTVCNESREGVVNRIYARFRADKLLVISIKHKETGKNIDRIQNSLYVEKIWYVVSKEVSVTNYCQDLNKVFAPGIHYFLSREPALYWRNSNIEDGPWKSWYKNGEIYEEGTLRCGKWHGSFLSRYRNGQKEEEITYVDGKLDGPHLRWYRNGQKKQECTYVKGELSGFAIPC